jgi:hypothetical protein
MPDAARPAADLLGPGLEARRLAGGLRQFLSLDRRMPTCQLSGMNRRRTWTGKTLIGVPRTRGDEPLRIVLIELDRGLGIPNVVDRVVQQAALQVLEPIFEPTFHPSSHGFRPHRGAHTAIAQAKEHLTAGYQMVVDIDLSKFFDRVHHQRLLDRIAQRVSDRRLLAVVRHLLTAEW